MEIAGHCGIMDQGECLDTDCLAVFFWQSDHITLKKKMLNIAVECIALWVARSSSGYSMHFIFHMVCMPQKKCG